MSDTNQLDPKVVAKIAYLARLSKNPSPEFLAEYGKHLSSILDYVKELSNLDTKDVSPLSGLRTIEISELDEDETNSETIEYAETRQLIIDNFPSKKGDYLVLAGIFEEN